MAYGQYGQGYQNIDGNPNTPVITIQGTPQTASATATLTAAQLSSRILVANPSTSAATYTTPTAAALDTAFPVAQPNHAFDLNIVNLGTSSGAITLSAGTGITLVGSATIAITSSAALRFRKTATGAWTVYRIV
jgi:hypothetical protein